MAFTVDSIDAIHGKLLADFANRFPQANLSRFSDNWKRLRVEALGVAMLEYFVLQAFGAAMPDSAVGDELDRHGTVHGVPRKGATASHKTAALRLVGTPASAYHTTDLLTSKGGLVYAIGADGAIPGGGFVDVDVESVSAGSATRLEKGDVLTFQAAPAGIQSTAELQLAIDEGGDDEEPDQDYRARILAKIAQPGMGGNANDYVSWALAVLGVQTAHPYPLRNGLGTVDLAALHGGSGSSRALSAPERATLQAAVDLVRPVAMKGFRVISTTAVSVDVELVVDVYDDAQYSFDWDDSVPTTVVAVASWAAREVTVALLPPDLQVGDRVVFRQSVAPYQSGAQFVVEALPGANVIRFTVESWQATAPAIGNPMFAGGPLVEPLRQAVLAMADSLGPARGTTAPPTLQWEDSVRLSVLYRICMATAGVREATIAQPGATVTPAHLEPTAAIEFLVPRQVVVRGA